MAYFWPAATLKVTSSTARSAPKARVTPLKVSASPESSWPLLAGIAPGTGPPRDAVAGLSEVIDAIGRCALETTCGSPARPGCPCPSS